MKTGKLTFFFRNILITGCIVALLLCGSIQAGEDTVPALINCPIVREEEFGGVYIKNTIEEFNALGFEYGDSVDIVFSNGYQMEDIPYYNGYYTQNGEPLLVAYPGYAYIDACINNSDSLWMVGEFDESMEASVTLHEKAKYLNVQEARDIHYQDIREEYPSDIAFANFRTIGMGELREGIVYRGASPCNNSHNRAKFVDELIKEAGVRYIIDLADNEEKLAGFMEAEDFDSPYFLSLYEAGKVELLGMNTNYGSEEFRAKVASCFRVMVQNEGPYYIHCMEGKDRTGFICMILEAFAGAGYQEIVDDYMITYDNYYQINAEYDKEKYDTIIENVLNPMIRVITGGEDPEAADLAACALQYLKDAGLTDQEIEVLYSHISGE